MNLHDTEHSLLTVSRGTAVEEERVGIIDNLSDFWNKLAHMIDFG